MPHRIAILGSERSPYVGQLSAALHQHSMVSKVLSWQELQSGLPAQLDLDHDLSDYDGILVRSMPLGSLEQVIFRMDCLQVALDRGTFLLNPPKCLEVAIDKWLSLHRLQQFGIEIPATIGCQTREQAFAAWEHLGRDVLVKPLFGGEGRGILRVQDADMAWRVFSTLQQTHSVFYIQQYLEHFGYDIRVLFIGEQAWAIKRFAKQGEWRSNVALGARVEQHELTEAEHLCARRAAEAIAGQGGWQTVLGVDLLPCRDGVTRVLEVNAVPGWKGVAQAHGVDIADAIIQFSLACLNA